MRTLLLSLFLTLCVTFSAAAQNIETMYGLYLGEPRSSVEAYIKKESDWILVLRNANESEYSMKKRSNISLTFTQGFLSEIFATYPMEEKKYQMDNMKARYGNPDQAEESTELANTTIFFWFFDGWRAVLFVYENNETGIGFYIDR